MHSCNLCGKSFRRKRNLQRHQVSCAIGRGRKKAEPSSKFICEVCGKIFARKDSLKQHFRGHHKVEVQEQLTAFKRRIFAKYFSREAAWRCT